MNETETIHRNDIWLSQIFEAKPVLSGGVVRRKVADVERKVGRLRLELEVRKRGFHLIRCGSQFVILCDTGERSVVC